MFNIFYFHTISLRIYQLEFDELSTIIYRIRFETNYNFQEKIDFYDICERIFVVYELKLILIFRKNYHTKLMELHKCDFQEITQLKGKPNDQIITLKSQLVLEIPMSEQKENPIAIHFDQKKWLCYLYADFRIHQLSLQSLQQKEGKAVIMSTKCFQKLPVNPKRHYQIVKQNNMTLFFQISGQFEEKLTNFQIITIHEDNSINKKTIQIPYPKGLIPLDDKQTMFPQISKAKLSDSDEILITIVTQIRKQFIIQQVTLDENLSPFLVAEEIRQNKSQEYYLEVPSDKAENTVLLPVDSFTIQKKIYQNQTDSEIFQNQSNRINQFPEQNKILKAALVC